jgi:hypothetical protein
LEARVLLMVGVVEAELEMAVGELGLEVEEGVQDLEEVEEELIRCRLE